MKKKALLSSILTIALCLSLIAGSTFALFTSESKVNVAVTAGKVDVVATIENLALYSPTSISKDGNIIDKKNAASNENFKNGGTATRKENKLTLTSITPGDKVTFNVKITNNSNVTVQYRSIVEKIVDDGLWAGLKVTIGEESYNGETKKSDWTVLEVGSKDIIVPVVIELPATAGNEYQEKSCELAYTVEAVQGNAQMPDEWDGTTDPITKSDDNKYHITSASEFAWMMAQTNGLASIYSNEAIVLDCDIDFGGATITGFGHENMKFGGSFDGQGHTVSNFVIDRSGKEDYAGLFNYYSYGTIENLNVKNATVIGQSKVGALLGSIDDGATVKNCTIENCTVIADRKVGGAVGYAQNATVNNITVKNTTVYCGTTEQAYEKDQWGKVIGYKNTGYSEQGNVAGDDVVVLTGVSYIANGVMLNNGVYEISNAQGLVYCAKTFNDSSKTNNKKFKLVADIDMSGIEWTPWCNENHYFNGRFNGDGHTISNLTIVDDHTAYDGHGVGFIGRLGGGADNQGDKTLENVTFDNATVSGHHLVGVAVGYNEYGTVDNVKVTNSKVTATHVEGADSCGDKAGALIGMCGPNGTLISVTNCSATNCTVTAARDAAQLIGYGYSGVTFTNLSATNVTVTAAKGDCTHERAGVVSTNALVGNGTEAGLTLN